MSFQRNFWKVRTLLEVDRVAAEDGHAELALELTESERVVATTDGAVVVEVEAAGDPGVGRRDEGVAVVDRLGTVVRHLEVVVPEQVDGDVARHVVELVDEQHVRAGALDDLGDRRGLGVVRRRQVRDQLARHGPVERGVEGLEPDRLAVAVSPVTTPMAMAAPVSVLSGPWQGRLRQR